MNMRTVLLIGSTLAMAACSQTREDGVKVAYRALRDGDRTAFCNCLTRNIAAKRCGDDRWFAVWREGALKMSQEEFSLNVEMANEDGRWKVAEE